jgi:hypothetical protein
MPSLQSVTVVTFVARIISVVAEKWPVQTQAQPRGIYGKTVGSTKSPNCQRSVEVQVHILKKLLETKDRKF